MREPIAEAARQMIDWVAEVMPDATPDAFARKFAEEAGELLGFAIGIPDDWTFAAVDVAEARDCALVLVALVNSVGGSLGADMAEKMGINRGRCQHRRPDGTYHHTEPAP